MFIIFFLWIGTILPFLHSEGNEPLVMAWLNIIFKGLQMVSPHIFNMWILILSCPWALLWSRLWIIFPISFAENVAEDNCLLVRKLRRLVESLLWLAKKKHCLEKKELKTLVFHLKSALKRFLQYKGGISDIFFIV